MSIQEIESGFISATGTHFPILAGIVAQTAGPVLEMGCGWYSTPMLHYLCKRRPLFTAEANQIWLNYFSNLYRRGTHDFEIATNNDYFSCKRIELIGKLDGDNKWAVAFVDHSPAEKRVESVERLRWLARYIVVHDSELNAVAYRWGNIFDTFKYSAHFAWTDVRTSIVSMTDKIEME